MYLEKNINKRCQTLINNIESGYFYLFKKLYEIIGFEKIAMVTFEIGKIKSLKQIFKNAKYIGCFFHYNRALHNKIKEICLLANSEFVGIKD